MESLELFPVQWRDLWSGTHEDSEVGAIYTKPEIVETILDLAGYSPTQRDLSRVRLLEPSCGDGAFIQSVVRRLLESVKHHRKRVDWRLSALNSAITATDLSLRAIETTRESIVTMLEDAGAPSVRARELAQHWVREADFLLEPFADRFDFVVGNPPYVRLEELPKRVLGEYRRRFSTLTDRADLYVGFFERGLELLNENGCLAFICANRFAKNQYGAALRRLISTRFHVRYYVNLEHTQPFVSDVSAYPAIVVLDRARGQGTRAGTLADISDDTLARLRAPIGTDTAVRSPLGEFADWYPSGSPWISTSSHESAVLGRFVRSHPTIQDSGGVTKVGIGVATGADAVFVLPEKSGVIEDSRQLPLLMSQDVASSGLKWGGRFLVNPFADADDGSLASLPAFPGFAAHLATHGEQLRERHVAKMRPNNWYRTIDRIWPALRATPKLVIPDIQRGGVIGLDSGEYYPHHNLYWITSDVWDLRALMTLLRSTHVLTQVRAHSVQMRGGSVRYQAQTLRRVHIPAHASLRLSVLERLSDLAHSASQDEIDDATSDAFGFAASERSVA